MCIRDRRKEEEDEHRPVKQRLRSIHVRRLRRQHVHVVAEVHELVVQVRRQIGQEIRRACEHDRGNLAGPTADCQDAARQDPAHRLRQDDPGDGLKLRRAESEASVPELSRHRAQGLLRRYDDDRQREDGQRQRGPDERRLPVRGLPAERSDVDPPPHRGDEEAKAKEPEDDGRNTGEVRDANVDEASNARPGGLSLIHI